MLWGEMPPSAPGSQGQRQHSGRRAATAAATGSTLASVTMPAPVRRAPSTVSAAAPPLAFYALCAADPTAWIAADTVLSMPLIRNILRMDYRYLRGGQA